MRYVGLPAVTMLVACGLVPSVVFGQGPPSSLAIANYQYVSEQRISQASSYVTYRADLVNSGAARNAVTASVSSLVPSIQVVPGQGVLHFAPVPANRTVTTPDTFTILVDRTVAFDFANLQWTFLAPVANAGANRTAKVGSLVILDGSGSTNPSGFGTLMYNWKIVSTPPGSSTVLFWSDTVAPQFTVDAPGNYVISLTVSNGGGSDTVTVTVSTTNTPPVANAGANRTASPGAVVTLNGSGSSDVDGDPLTYSWTIINRPAGSTAVLLAPISVTPVFTVDKAGSYDIRLIVNDGKVDSAPSVVTITTLNTPPVANAGPNQVRSVGALVQLDGSGSTDVDGDPLTYQWSLIGVPTGSTAVLSSATAVKPTFTADLPGTYVAQLIVNDGKAPSAAATVQITTNPPLAPTASAGPNQTVAHGTTVHLNGSGTDPQNLPLTFQWSLTLKPALSAAVLSSTTSPNPTFLADLPGNYVAQLIVNNGVQPSTPSMVTITTTNTAPVANPGLNQFVPAPASVTLDGSGSSDADGDPLTYAWSFSSRPPGSTATLSSLTAVSPTLFADVAGTYVVQLIVSDGFSSSSPVTVTITAGVKAITLSPNPLNLSTNTPGSLTVSLGSLAGPGGQLVFLDSSNGTIASIQANVTVPEGLAGVNVQVMPGSGAGSTTITALASGFTPGFAQVNVTPPTITVTLSAGIIGLTRTVNGTLTLSSPAPTGGVSVTLSDLAGFVTFQPATVPFAAGATTATFTATGAAIGSTTILAGAPGYNTGTANVTVAMLGAITLLSNVTVGPGQSVPFPVSLVTGAPLGGVTISLVSSDASKVTISPSSVTIAQGATTPTVQPTVTGVNLGSAEISASAPGFFGDKKTVQVAATLSFQQQTLTIGVNGTQDLTLNLSGPAPASGLVVNISSSNLAAVTVPSTVTFAATKTSVTVPVTGIAVGTSVIHASAAALADTTATVNVVNVGAIGLPSNATVGLGAQVFFPVTLPAPAPAGGVTVSLASTDTSKLTISAASITIPAGQTAPATQPMITGVNVGTASITASATGYTSASQAVQITATISFAPPTLTITGSATVNAVLNLSAAAPSGGLTINLSSSNPSVATVPLTVTFPAGAASANVAVTSGTPGTAVIHASGTNIPDATTNVTVLPGGSVNVPASLSLVLGQSVALNVSLSSAPSSPVTITLVSSDPAKVSIPSTVTIPAGQTTPVIQTQVTGVNIGTATISASATGYTPGSTAVQVGATIAFTQPSLTITGAITQNLTLTLSAAAPAGGVTINLSSSNTGVATVPLTVAFGQGATTTSVPVTGVAAGSAVIHASNLPNIADVTANVTVLILGPINVPSNPSVGLGQTIAFPVTLSAAAPAAVTIALASTDPSKVTISVSSVSIAQGATVPTQQPTITGINLGSASINATATGYSSGSATVQVTATIAFTPPSVTLTGGGTQNLTLTLSGQAPSGGLAVNLSSSNVSVGTVPSTVTFAPGSTTVLVPLTILGSGSTVIHASNLPNLADTTSNVTVQNSIALPASVNVAPGQQAPFTITLGAPAPANGVTVLLSSSDTSKVTLVSGSVFINPGQTSPNATPAVNAIDFGNATVTASANGYGSATTSVHVTASASFFPSIVSVVAGSGTQNLSLVLSAPAPTGVTFTLTSSNAGVATAPVSVTIPANQNNVNVPVTLGGPGSTTITASTATPNIANTTASVTVTAAGTIGLPSNLTVAPNQPTPFPVTLGSAAPAGGVTVALSSSDTSKVTISAASVFIAAGQVSPSQQPSVTGVNYGTANINATASGYAPASAPVQVTATMSFASPTVTINGITTQNVALNLSAAAPPSGLTVNLTSGNTGAVTVPTSVSFPGGGTTVNVLLTAVAPGSATITAAAVAPGIANATTSVTVSNTATINLPASGTLGLGQTASFPVSLSSPAAAPVTIALASTDTNRVTLSTASVTIGTGQTTPTTQPTITGINFGAVNINATASGYPAASSAVQVTATVVFSPLSLTMSTGTQNLTLTLSAAAPAGGVIVNLSSSNTGAVTVPGSVSFSPGSSVATVPVTAIAPGSATIHASSLPNIADSTASVTVQGGITLPANVTVPPGQQALFPVTLGTPAPNGGVTVSLSSSDTSKVSLVSGSVFFPQGQTTPTFTPTVTGVDFGSSTITATANGYGSANAIVQVTGSASFFPASLVFSATGTKNLSLTLSVPAPSSVTFTLSSSSSGVATVPLSVTIAAGQNNVTVPVTAVGPGSTTITASTTTPNIANATAGVTVSAPGLINVPVNLNVGLSTSVDFPVTLGSPAPAGGATVTLTSSDSSKLSISPGTVNIAAGDSTPATQPKVTGINIGAVTITASAPSYTTAVAQEQVTATVSYAPSSLSIVATTTQNFTLTLSGSAPAGGIPVTVTSSNTAVATVPQQQFIFLPNGGSASTLVVPVTGVTTGTALIHVGAPPFIPDTTASVTVLPPGAIGLPANVSVGPTLSVPFAVTLGTPAPAGGVTVTLASADNSKLTISPLTVNIAAGDSTPATQPTVTGVDYGTVNITASAPGYVTASAAVKVTATMTFASPTVTITGITTQNVALNLSAPAPAAGLTVNLASSNPSVATVVGSVIFPANAITVNVPVTSVSTGPTTITATAVASTIANATTNVTVVSQGAVSVPANLTVLLGQTATLAVTLTQAPSSNVTVALSSGDTSKVTISPGSVTILAGQTTPGTQPTVTGVNLGTANITATASGYTSGTTAVQVHATVNFPQNLTVILGTGAHNLTLTLSAAAPASGITVNLTSDNLSVATVPATVTFTQGQTTVSVPVTPVGVGVAVIHAANLPNIADATANVTVAAPATVNLPASPTVGLGASATFAVSLASPAPVDLTIALASSDITKLTITPASITILAGQSTPGTQPTITGVSLGSANITATGTGVTSASATVQVNATISFAPPTVTITGLVTQSLTLNLSGAAPASGLTINFNSSAPSVATVPASVSFAAGATSLTVPVTAVGLGSTTITASTLAPNVPNTTAAVTVVAAGSIGLPAGVTVGLGGSAPFAVTLPVAPASAVTVTLSSSDPTRVSVTPTTVSIAAGQTTPASQPVVTGLNTGSASVSASAPGYTTASQTVTVVATVSWPQPAFTFTALGTQGVTLTLSAAAPANGLSVILSSSNQLVAAVPATVTFAAGSNTVTVPVTALGTGSTVLHAIGVNIPDSTATLTVTIVTQGVITVSNATVGKDLQALLTINLSTVVPPGLPLQVTVSSSDGSKLVLGSLLGTGTPSMILGFPVGSNSGVLYAQALAGSGSVTVTVSAPGYTSGSNTVTLTPSGFVMTGPTGVVGVPSFPTNVGNTTTLTVMTGRLDSSFVYQESQGLRGGFSVTVPLVSSNGTIGNVSPSSRTFTAADTAYTTTFTALAIGATTLSATPPTGFSTPAAGAGGITANVAGGLVSAPNVTVGQSLEVPAQVTLTGAPSVATTITLTSSDPNKLRFGISATDAGAGTIPIPGCLPPAPDPTNACKIVKVGAGQSHTPDIYFQALASTGSATYTAVIPGFGTATGTVTFRPSSILITGPFGLGNSITTTTGSAATELTVESAMLVDATPTYQLQAVAAITGVPPVSVNVTSSNTGVGTITVSPVTIPAGQAGATSGFLPGSAGSSTLSVSVPSGFSVPAAFGSVVASVSTSGIGITQGVSIGKFLQIQGNFTLGAPAPAGLIVHLASSNTSALLLSTSPTAAGLGSIDITMTAGAFGGTYYIQALSDTGTVTYTASAPGYAAHTGSITLTPSGVVVGDGINPGAFVLGNSVVVSMAQLDPGNVFGQVQQLVGGHAPVSIVMNTTIGTATIASPVTISPGADSAPAPLTGSGSGTVTATTPPGFTDSNFLTVTVFLF